MASLASYGLSKVTVADPRNCPNPFLSNLHPFNSPIFAKSFYNSTKVSHINQLTYLQIIVSNLLLVNVSNLESSLRRLQLDLLNNLSSLKNILADNLLLLVVLSHSVVQEVTLSLSLPTSVSKSSWSIWSSIVLVLVVPSILILHNKISP